ncbi:MAG: cyclodeaminase/cyclohydrolase family protein [Planctomycetota bacterium]|nr:cyclodeaminase/cyclohydrolase family protein [Planctomycetota bacterium]
MSLDLHEVTLSGFLTALAERTPTPGGGAVAAASLALAGAIGHMAIAYSRGRSSLAAFESVHEDAMTALSDLAARALDLAEQDAAAYARLNDLFKKPEDDPERSAQWDDAVEAAIAAPMAVMQEADTLLQRLQGLVEATTPMLRSDLAVAAITAESAARSANCNVRINLPSVSDVARADTHRSKADELLTRCKATASNIETECGAH